MSILNYFDSRGGRTPRDAQADALRKVEDAWDHSDVILVRAPTAAGKTLLLDCIAAWRSAMDERCIIVVPDNMLLGQAEKEAAPAHKVMWAQKFYTCKWKGLDDRYVTGTRADCPWQSCRKRFTNGCPYNRALTTWKHAKVKICNYWMPMSQKVLTHADVMLIDEAHCFGAFLSSLTANHVWHHDVGYPLEATTYGQLKTWINKEIERCENLTPEAKKSNRYAQLKILHKEINDDAGKVSIVSTLAEYRGQLLPCIEIKPIDVRDALKLAINRKVTKKIVMVSATIGMSELTELGLDRTRVAIIDVESPIPVERRPVFIRPCISNRAMEGYKDIQALIKILCQAAVKFPNDKGIVHLTYDMSRVLKGAALPKELLTRLLFHDKLDKKEVLAKFLASNEPLILIGCGMTEGLDLKGDLARFNIIAKINWPSLGDPVIARKMENDPEYYSYLAARSVMQAAGRVCRDPNDYGETYILDKSIAHIDEKQWLKWFSDAIVEV